MVARRRLLSIALRHRITFAALGVVWSATLGLGQDDPLPPGASARIGTARFRSADAFLSVAYTPDGSHLVTGGWGGARLWDAKTGRLLRRFGAELTNPTEPAALSPDGALIAVGGWGEEMGGAVYELATGQRRYRFGAPSISVRAAFAPDGKLLAYGPRNDGAIVVLEAATGKEVRALPAPVNLQGIGLRAGFAFTSDSKVLVGVQGGSVRVWDVAAGKLLRTLGAADQEIVCLAVSPDNVTMALVPYTVVAGPMGQQTFYPRPEVTLLDLATGKELRRIAVAPVRKQHGLYHGPMFLVFTPDGKELVAGGADGILRVFDVPTGAERRRIGGHRGYLGGAAFGPAGEITVIESRSLRRRNFATGRDLDAIHGHREGIEDVALSPDGKTAATTTHNERRVVLWDVRTGAEVRQLDGANESFHCLAFSADGARLFALGYDDSLWIWDAATGKERRRVNDLRHARTFAVSLDGRHLAVAGQDNIRLLRATDGTEVRTLTGATKGIAGLDFSSDGAAVQACTSDGKLHRWDTQSGGYSSRDFYQLAGPFSVAFARDGRLVTFGVQNSDFLPVVDAASGREFCRFAIVPKEPAQNLLWAAFSPDSRTLAWGGRKDGSVWLGELATGLVRHQLVGHGGRVQSLAWSADGKTLLTASADTTALVWDLAGTPAPHGALSAADLTAAWAALGGTDAKVAFAAARRLAGDPERSVDFLRRQLKPAEAADARRLAALLTDLDSADFATREKAAQELRQLGEPALPALRQAAAHTKTLETRRRLERLLERLEPLTADRIQAIRAVEALERSGTPAAQRLLKELANGAPEARLTREARETLARLR